MRICLAGTANSSDLASEILNNCDFLLESYLYFKEWQKPLIDKMKLFIVDSGAFTFMQSKKDKNYKKYLIEYANFLKNHKIDYFMNLDLDYIIGVEETKKLTDELERIVGKQSIPVFHRKAGWERFKEMVREYKYIAIGTIYEYRKNPKMLQYLVEYANDNGCKVHGLGFTIQKQLNTINFYSVDSTTWLSGNQYGIVFQFNGEKMLRHFRKKKYKN